MYKSILFLVLIICTLTCCFKERITPNYNDGDNKKVIINGWISTLDQPQYISVSYSVNYLGGFVPDMISDAEVTLKDSQTTYTLEEKEAGNYYLPASWTPIIGDEYTLKVVFEGQEYIATHKMRPSPELEDFYTEEVEEDSFAYYQVYFSFQETPGEGDAYYVTEYPIGTTFGDSLTNGGFANDDFADGQYFSDISLDIYSFQVGDTAVIDFFSIGSETAKYLQDIETEIFRGSIFDPPPANVRTNFTGGAQGYFIISDARREYILIE